MKVIDYGYGAFIVEDYLVRGRPTILEVSTAESIRRGRSEVIPVSPTRVLFRLKYSPQMTMNASGDIINGRFNLTNLTLASQEGLGDLVAYQEDLNLITSNPTILAEIRKRQASEE